MELHERISVIRKAMGMTQEQLGKKIGVSSDTIAAWESGETVPDALSIGGLCRGLNLSADYVLLGNEPDDRRVVNHELQKELEIAEAAYQMPDICPCCGRNVSGTLCPVCGYPLPVHPPRGNHYAVIALYGSGCSGKEEERVNQLVKYCGLSREDAETTVKKLQGYGEKVVLRRDMTDHAAFWLAKQFDHFDFYIRIVEDMGEAEEDLVNKETAMELPPSEKKTGGLGFWGVVGAIIVALLILSLF